MKCCLIVKDFILEMDYRKSKSIEINKKEDINSCVNVLIQQ